MADSTDTTPQAPPNTDNTTPMQRITVYSPNIHDDIHLHRIYYLYSKCKVNAFILRYQCI